MGDFSLRLVPIFVQPLLHHGKSTRRHCLQNMYTTPPVFPRPLHAISSPSKGRKLEQSLVMACTARAMGAGVGQSRDMSPEG